VNDKALARIPLPEVQTLAEMLSKSSLLPDGLKGKPADIAVQVMAGNELGLAPMASIRGVHVVQGKPVLAADTMVALVHGSGLCEYFQCVEETETKVTYETKRKGAPAPQRVTWSDEDTKLAGLQAKDNWRAHKRQMRRARCKAILARDAYPDVLAGCYEEFESEHVEASAVTQARPVPPAPVDVIDAELATPAETVISAIDNAASHDELTALKEQLKALPEEAKAEARSKYTARWNALKPQEQSA
jgi:hypothetical protein